MIVVDRGPNIRTTEVTEALGLVPWTIGDRSWLFAYRDLPRGKHLRKTQHEGHLYVLEYSHGAVKIGPSSAVPRLSVAALGHAGVLQRVPLHVV